MAGDWIKMRADIAEDPAVIGIAATLGLDEFSVVGRLQVLWSWADGQSRDGHARGVTQEWVNRKVQCDNFAQAMCKFGWLQVTEAGIAFPNFDHHNGETAKSRALGTKRKQKQRSSDAEAAGVTQTSDEMSRTERDKSETREEKRREETSSSLRSEDVARETPGEVCKAMRSVGMADVSPSHPKLLSLLAEGLTQAELVDAAVIAVKGKKPFSYALATAEGRRRDAAIAPLPSTPRLNAQEALEAANRAVGERFLAEQGAARATH